MRHRSAVSDFVATAAVIVDRYPNMFQSSLQSTISAAGDNSGGRAPTISATGRRQSPPRRAAALLLGAGGVSAAVAAQPRDAGLALQFDCGLPTRSAQNGVRVRHRIGGRRRRGGRPQLCFTCSKQFDVGLRPFVRSQLRRASPLHRWGPPGSVDALHMLGSTCPTAAFRHRRPDHNLSVPTIS